MTLPAAALLVLCLALPATPAAAAPRLDDALPAPVAAALDNAGLPHESFAAIALPQTRWARRWQYRAETPMQPGSTMKLVTTVVALDRLGPNHRGRTELLAAGPIEGEVLNGELVLKGGADPDLDLPALWSLLFELRQRGVREIAGGLLLDRTLFRPARIDIGVPPFDEAPEWPYNVIPDALMLSGNLMRLALGSDANTVQARLAPPLEGIELDASALRLTDTSCRDWDDDWLPPQATPGPAGRWRLVLQGGFPRAGAARTAATTARAGRCRSPRTGRVPGARCCAP
jgi:serine-type D-Ala-D-Ala carboxypeptidase/endopeptidase (penicillin-binding protein 4)